MTPNRAKIVITNPCSEDWNSMSADAAGRFCQSCQKSVIDFSSKSDEEIRAFLKNKQGEQLCGRFFVHQVERIRIEIDPNLLVSGIPFWQKFLAILLVCFGADFLGCDFVFAQMEIDSIPARTEQMDSLAPLPLTEADTTLEVIIDSVQKPARVKKDINELIWSLKAFPIISGSITLIGNHYPLFDGIPSPPLDIPIGKKQPEQDTTDSITGIAYAENLPIAPKHPKRKPTFPENAIMADTGERRKTRRS